MIEPIIKNLSKIAFLFVVFAVIAGGVVQHVLSCQMQEFLKESELAKHFVGIILLFFFIMLEGGWDFDDEENNKAPIDWASGNVIHTGIYSIGIYLVFILTSKTRLIPNMILFGLLFIVYLLNTQRLYWKNRNKITEETDNKIIRVELLLLVISLITVLYGIYDYSSYKMKNLGSRFKWHRFFFHAKECSFDGSKDINLKKIGCMRKR